MVSSFAKGLVGGFADSLSEQRKDAREEARDNRTMLMQHYLNVVVPQYRAAKAGAATKRKQIKSFQLLNGASEEEALTSLKSTGWDEGKALEFFHKNVKPAREPAPGQTVPAGGVSAQTAAILEKEGAQVPPVQPSTPAPTPQVPVTSKVSPEASTAVTGATVAATPQISQNFFNEVIIGRKTPAEISSAVESTLAGEFGMNIDEVKAFMADPTIFEAELEGAVGPVPTTGITTDTVDLISKQLLGNISNVKEGFEKDVVGQIIQAREKNDVNALVEIADKFYSAEELEAIEDAAGAGAADVKAAQQNVALKVIAPQFGLTINPDGSINFGNMKPEDMEAWALVTKRVSQHLGTNPNGLDAGQKTLNELLEARDAGAKNLVEQARTLPSSVAPVAKAKAVGKSAEFYVNRLENLPAEQREQWLLNQNLPQELQDQVVDMYAKRREEE